MCHLLTPPTLFCCSPPPWLILSSLGVKTKTVCDVSWAWPHRVKPAHTHTKSVVKASPPKIIHVTLVDQKIQGRVFQLHDNLSPQTIRHPWTFHHPGHHPWLKPQTFRHPFQYQTTKKRVTTANISFYSQLLSCKLFFSLLQLPCSVLSPRISIWLFFWMSYKIQSCSSDQPALLWTEVRFSDPHLLQTFKPHVIKEGRGLSEWRTTIWTLT